MQILSENNPSAALRVQISSVFVVIFMLTITLFCARDAAAQFDTATINGTVRDQSDAVIPNATIDIRNRDTGLDRSTSTNASGTYSMGRIPPGVYSIEVRSEGFSSSRRENVTLSVSQALVLDFTLNVGGTTSTVQVESSQVNLDTASATIGTSLNTQTVNELPLNGRNYTDLLLLQPGVTGVNHDQTGGRTNSVGTAVFPSIQGQNNRSNSYFLDGVNNNEAISGAQTITPIPDDILEMRVVAHSDSSQFGGAMGGIINVITKSGTNTFHGSAWEFWRGSRFMDAKNPITGVLQDLHQNQYGVSIGGPVLLPHYSGKDKTFFYGSYEGYRQKIGAVQQRLVPTSAQLSGDFSALLSQSTPTIIYNPYTRQPFTNNQIPSNLIDQNMVNLANAIFPAPNGSYNGGKANWQGTVPSVHNSDQYDLRGDEYLTKKDQVWAHYLHQNNPISSFGGLPNLTTTTGYVAHNFGAQWLHTFSANSLLTVGFGQNIGLQTPTTMYGGDVASLIATAHFAQSITCGILHPVRSSGCMLPQIGMGSYMGGGENQGSPNYTSDVWEYSADFQQRFSRHTLFVGFNVDTNNQGKATSSYTSIGFSTVQTNNGTTGGDEVASFILGLPNSASRNDAQNQETGGFVQGYYVQDQWKVRDNLTINAGLRYDLSLLPVIHNAQYGAYYDIFDYNTGNAIIQNMPPPCSSTQFAPCMPGGALPDHVIVSAHPGKLFFPDKKNWQPRFGITYAVRPDTVLHAGYGRAYDNWAAVDQSAQNVDGWLMKTAASVSNLNTGIVTPATAITAENPLGGFTGNYPTANPFSVTGSFNIAPQFVAPHTDQWTVGIQQKLGSQGVWTINYVGSRGRNLDLGLIANTALPGADPFKPRTPFPYMGQTHFDVPKNMLDYHALETTFQGRSAKTGLAYLLSYTWSKGLDIGADGWYGSGTSSIEHPYDLEKDRAVTGYTLAHVFTAGWTWSVPVGKNAYSTGNRTIDYAIGNWKLNGILTLESGMPYNISVSGDIGNTGNTSTYERPNLVGDPTLSHPTRAKWFNTAAFAAPAQYTLGTLGRNSMRTQPYKNFDASLFRNFPVYREAQLNIRLDVFNAPNHPVWGTPGNNLSSTTSFGVISSMSNSPRQLQLSGKITF